MSDQTPKTGVDRRRFAFASAAVPLTLTATGLLGPSWLKALAKGSVRMSKAATGAAKENLYWAFIPIHNPETGESDEFTTIHNLERLLEEHGVPKGTTIIGTGARSGTADDVFGQPGEMGYVWTYGDPWQGSVTSTVDATPVPLGKDDPIIVTQVGVLTEDTAHHIDIDDPSLAGSVLWTFHQDDTERTIFKRGLHNSFSDVDNGATNTLFTLAKEARANPDGWASEHARSQLTAHLPNLADDSVWDNFKGTFGTGILYQQWLPYIQQQGWQGAAVILRGSFMNVNQFHLRQWNAKTPQDPLFELFKGTHPPLGIRYAREVRPYVDTETADWTMVGFIWDTANAGAQPTMEYWRTVSDLFGQPFHIHGFRDDAKSGGHTLMCTLGETGKLSVSLYPLRFVQGDTAMCFNNDLMVVAGSLAKTDGGFTVVVRNDGENFARNVRVDLAAADGSDVTTVTLPLVAPRQDTVVAFTGDLAQAQIAREIRVDPLGHFMEGGEGAANNVMKIDGALRWVPG